MSARLALAAAVAAIALVAGLSASCLVDRRTGGFECTTQSDCADGRVCTGGYCVVDPGVLPDAPPVDTNPCPSPCDSCNLTTQTCTVTCDSASACSDLACPAGFTCDIHCTAGNACDDIDCSAARACLVECDAANACGNVTCGAGRCDVTCNGNNACDDVRCDQACECDVDCDGGGDCASALCPTPTAGAGDCTDGTAAGCDSTQANCTRTCL